MTKNKYMFRGEVFDAKLCNDGLWRVDDSGIAHLFGDDAVRPPMPSECPVIYFEPGRRSAKGAIRHFIESVHRLDQ